MQSSTDLGFRLSPQQKQIWMLQQAFPAQPFCALCALTLYGNFRTDLIQQALRDVVNRHEILRTTFQRPPGIKVPFQVISENATYSWESVDLSNFDMRSQQDRVEAWIAAERKRAFDLEQGPMLRALLLNLATHRDVLILALPAMCSDSITIDNFVNELTDTYQSSIKQQQFSVETIQYADFAEWQNQFLETDDERAAELRDYWKRKEITSLSVPELPFEKHLIDHQTFELESVSLQLQMPLVENIKAIAFQHRASISSVFFACWQNLIWRLAGSKNFAIQMLYNGRKLDDVHHALGAYARYLPIHCQLDNDSFGEQLLRVTQAFDQADERQEYFDPFDSSVMTGDAIGFDFEEREATQLIDASSFGVLHKSAFISPFKLKLACVVSGDEFQAELQYDERVFDRQIVERMSGYFLRLLQAVTYSIPNMVSELRLATVDLLGDEEKRSLLVDINQTDTKYSQDKCIHELFEAQVGLTPKAPALVFDDRQLSYDELNVQANQVAHLLRAFGVGPNTCVGMCIKRSSEMIVGLLGILKAGGTYVPLNSEHPPARLIFQLAESQAKICLTNDPALAEELKSAGQTIDFSRDSELLRSQPEANPNLLTSSEGVVYVIYTSGSTGTPKGVAVRHRNLVNYTRFILDRLQVKSPLHFATISTISADLGNTCIFPSLVSGGCLHVLSYDVAMEGNLFSQYVARHPIDVLKIVPSHLHALLASSDGRNILPSKYLILGGEALSWELIDSILSINPSCKIINHYGPTETTIGSLVFNVDRNEFSASGRTVPIGRSIANTRAYVVDKFMRPVPTGVVGELYIGGAGVGLGYLNRPAETAARFVPDVFSSEPGSRLYRTGDLVRWLPDNNMEFLGRADRQVKVRGYRVELGEIESALRGYSRVRQAAVVVRNEEVAEKLVAYVVVAGATPLNRDELRKHLREQLPDYMVPSAIVCLTSFPLTANGKVDYAALPGPEESQVSSGVFVAPRTPLESELANIWSGLLKINEIGIHDNFFDLGGHSLLATQVVSRIRKILQKELPLRSIFESPTIAGLAAIIENSTDGSADLRKKLEALESLTEEEAERLLEREKGGVA